MIDWAIRQASRFVVFLRRRAVALRLRDLRAQGMQVGENVWMAADVSFDRAYPWLIEIAPGCRLSAGVRILTHDATAFRDLGITRLGRVRLERDVFLGERVLVLPGVTIGARAMVAAGSVVSRDVGEGALVAGNPAKVYGRYDEFLARMEALNQEAVRFRFTDIQSGKVSPAEVLAALDSGKPVLSWEPLPYTGPIE